MYRTRCPQPRQVFIVLGVRNIECSFELPKRGRISLGARVPSSKGAIQTSGEESPLGRERERGASQANLWGT